MLLLSFSFRSNGINFLFMLISCVLFFSAASSSFSSSDLKSKGEKDIFKIKAANPLEISSVPDGLGGMYFFWKESLTPINSKLYFAHIDLNSPVHESISGKKISELSFVQKNPLSIPYISNNAVLIWKDYSSQFTEDLYLQRISGDSLLWGENAVRVTNSPEHTIDFTLSSDQAGNIFIAYITKSEYPLNDFNLLYQRVLADGSLTYKSAPITVEKSPRKKNNLKIVHDNSGSVFLLWTELINNKESLLLKKVDPSGKSVFGKKPIKISGTNQSVKRFCTSFISNSLLYTAWETEEKNIYHQLINKKGKAIWAVGGIKASLSKGANTLPQTLTEDTLITLSWLNELPMNKQIMVQKFKTNGKEIWTNGGVSSATLNSQIINYSVSSDNEGGVFIAWLRDDTSNHSCLVEIQQINSKGKPDFDSLTMNVSSSANCNNNFIAVSTRGIGEAVIGYNDYNNEIVVEKIRQLKDPEYDFLNLSSTSNGKSVTLRLNTNLKNEKMVFILERLAHSDTSANIWEFIGSNDASPLEDSTTYEFIDFPDGFGTLYYRSTVKTASKELSSNISRVDFLEAKSKIIVAQNNPNPFNDSTVISFYLPEACEAGFEFFNGHAEKISALEPKYFPAGENSVKFYADDLPAGIYFFRFYSRDFVEVKKMIIAD